MIKCVSKIGSGGVIECKGLEIRPIRGGYMLTNQRRAGVSWGYRVQGARDSTNQRRVYVDQSEESRGLVGLSSARGSRFDQSEEGIC